MLLGSTAQDEGAGDSDIDLLAASGDARPLLPLDMIEIGNRR